MGESVAGDAVPVAVGGKDRLAHARARQVIREDGVHDAADIFVYVPAADPFLVVGGGGSDGEVVALVAIPFRI